LISSTQTLHPLHRNANYWNMKPNALTRLKTNGEVCAKERALNPVYQRSARTVVRTRPLPRAHNRRSDWQDWQPLPHKGVPGTTGCRKLVRLQLYWHKHSDCHGHRVYWCRAGSVRSTTPYPNRQHDCSESRLRLGLPGAWFNSPFRNTPLNKATAFVRPVIWPFSFSREFPVRLFQPGW